MVTTEAMREFTFISYERLVLSPVELVTAGKQTALNMAQLGGGQASGRVDGRAECHGRLPERDVGRRRRCANTANGSPP